MPLKPLCLVRSSINIDEMFSVPHVVRPGETISSSSLKSRPGGKGANVSAAVALAGQEVYLGGSVGKDATWPIDELKKRGVNIDSIRILEDGVPTGRAFIQVSKDDGENSIVLLKGANFHPDEKADNPEKVFASLPSIPTHLIVQNEIILETTKAFLSYAHSSKLQSSCMTIFNPSPMLSKENLLDFNWEDVDVLIVNEGEGKDLLEAMQSTSDGNDDILEALDSLQQLKHTSWIVMTKGARGVSARIRSQTQGKREEFEVSASKPRKVVDTTGAGDTFAGNLVAGLMEGKLPRETLEWAVLAASMAVEKDGAMESIPKHQDVSARQRESAR